MLLLATLRYSLVCIIAYLYQSVEWPSLVCYDYDVTKVCSILPDFLLQTLVQARFNGFGVGWKLRLMFGSNLMPKPKRWFWSYDCPHFCTLFLNKINSNSLLLLYYYLVISATTVVSLPFAKMKNLTGKCISVYNSIYIRTVSS